jgi:hypothetical protein
VIKEGAVPKAAMRRYHGVAWKPEGGSVGQHVSRISGIIVCCIVVMSLKPLPEAAERLSPGIVVNLLADGYVTTEKKEAKEIGSAVSQGGIKGFTSFRFKSKGPLAESSPPTYRRFHLRFYEYGSGAAAWDSGLFRRSPTSAILSSRLFTVS